MKSSSAFHSLFTKATYAYTGMLIGRISAAVAGILMARNLQTEMFGIYSALWELTLLCSSLTETGMTTGIQRDGALAHDRLGQLLGNALLVKLLIGIPALVIAYFYSPQMTAGHSMDWVYLFLALASAAVFLSEPMYSVLQVLGMQKKVAFIESLRGGLTLVAIAGLVLAKRGIVEMAFFQGIVYCLVFGLLVMYTLPLVRLRINLREAWIQCRSSFVFGISGLIFAVYARIPILFLSRLQGAEAVGYYAAGNRIISILYLVGIGAYLRAFLPSLFGYYKTGFKEFQAAANYVQQYFFITGALCAMAAYVGADTIIMLLLGPKYLESIAIIRILSIAVFMNYLLYAADAAITAANHNGFKILFQVSGTMVGAVAAYFLITHYAARGAAYASLAILAGLLTMFFLFAYKKQYLQFSAISRFGVPFSLLVASAIISVELLPHAFILRPLLFGVVGLMVIVSHAGGIKNLRQILPHKPQQAAEKGN